VLCQLYEVAGRVLSVRAFDEGVARSADRYVSGWNLNPVPGAADFRVACNIEIRLETPPAPPAHWHRFEIDRGSCYTDRETYYFVVGGTVTIVHPPASRLIEVWVREASGEPYGIAFSTALRRCGLYEFHAAGAVEPETGAGALISGPSGSGKSTIAVRLSQEGWRYLSDDTLLLSEGERGIEARGFRRVFALTETTVAACQLPHTDASARVRADGFGPDKRRLDPHIMFPAGPAESCLPKALFFAAVTYQEKSSVVRLGQAEAMAQLIRMCPWACYDAPAGRNHLRVLSRLARQSVSYLLHSGRDLLEQPGFASEFLAAQMRAGA
jgi:hypothetical protein